MDTYMDDAVVVVVVVVVVVDDDDDDDGDDQHHHHCRCHHYHRRRRYRHYKFIWTAEKSTTAIYTDDICSCFHFPFFLDTFIISQVTYKPTDLDVSYAILGPVFYAECIFDHIITRLAFCNILFYLMILSTEFKTIWLIDLVEVVCNFVLG